MAHAVLDATPHYALDRDFDRHMQREVAEVKNELAKHHWPLLHKTWQALVNLKASGFDIEPHMAALNTLVDPNASVTEAEIIAYRENLVLAYIQTKHAVLHGQLTELKQQQDAACAAGFSDLPEKLDRFRYEAILATLFERFQAGDMRVHDLMGSFNGDLVARLSSFDRLLDQACQSLQTLTEAYARISPEHSLISDALSTATSGASGGGVEERKAQPEEDEARVNVLAPPPCCTALVEPLRTAIANVVADPAEDLAAIWASLQEEQAFFVATVQPHADWLKLRQGVLDEMSDTLYGNMQQEFVRIWQQGSELSTRSKAMQDLLVRHHKIETFRYSENGEKLVAIRAQCADLQRHMQALALTALPDDLAKVGALLKTYDYTALSDDKVPDTYDADAEKLQKSKRYCQRLWQVKDTIRQYADEVVGSVPSALSESDLYTAVKQSVIASNRYTRDLHAALTQLERDVSALSGESDVAWPDTSLSGEHPDLREAVLTAVGTFMSEHDDRQDKGSLQMLQTQLQGAKEQSGNAFEQHARAFLRLAEPDAFAAAVPTSVTVPGSPMRSMAWLSAVSPSTVRGSVPTSPSPRH